jgi:hypothetical protein
MLANIRRSVTSLSQDTEMEGFRDAFGEEDAQALLFVAFAYAMGLDVRSTHSFGACDRLPDDLKLPQSIGILHLAELFDLEPLREAARNQIEVHLLTQLRARDLRWVFTKGSRLAGALMYRPDMPLKIALCERYTQSWDSQLTLVEERELLNLGRENVEFYLLVRSFCLAHVNEEGVNDV